MSGRGHWTASIAVFAVLLVGVPGFAGASPPPSAPPTPSLAGSWTGWAPIMYREPGQGMAAGPTEPAPTGTLLEVTVSLPFSQPGSLGTLLSSLDDPASPNFRQYLTATEFDAEFGGSAEPYTEWGRYVETAGATGVTLYGDRATLTFEATPEVAGAIFHTSIRLYHDGEGRPFYGPASAPEVPAPLAAPGTYVDGLSSYARYVIGTDASGRAVHPTLRPLVQRAATVNGYPAPVTLGGVQNQFISDYQVAYNQLSLYQQYGYPTDAVAATILWSGNYTGASVTTPYGDLTNNQAVGPFNPNDIYTYYNETLPTGEPSPRVYGAPLDGAPAPGPLASWDQTNSAFENTLDLEDLGALSPGSTIYNVYSSYPSFAGLDQAFAYVLSPNTTTPGLSNVSVISNSWGAPEINDTGWYQDLEEAQARGITVLAISGDSGDSPSSSWGLGDAFYPGSMAFDHFGDVAVGGTTNTLSGTTLALLHQHVWYDAAQAGGPVGSTGGVSSLFAEPSWQATTSAASAIAGAGRGVPDLSAIANNSLMTFTYEGYQSQATNASVNSNYYYSWGTSIATPVEAGILTDIDNVLQRTGNGWLGFLDPTLYPLASEEDAALVSNATVGYYNGPSYASTLPTLPLTDVAKGANAQYSASAGYDLATGWGAIDAYNLTMYYLRPGVAAVPGQWSGVRAAMNLTGLQVTSSYPGFGINNAYNASFQQNFFIANSLGAPVYWVQNVVYIYGVPGDWQMNFTGWLVYPFYGLEGSLTMYEYNAPITGVTEVPPVNFTFQTQILAGTGFNTQQIEFSFGTPGAPSLTLPAPGAAYIIGNLSYNYSWMGVDYSDGPYPAPYGGPGGLAPQFGLVGGPSGYIGNYEPPTSGAVQLSFSFGGPFLPGLTRAFGESIDQTGEASSNLTWTETSPGDPSSGIPSGWSFGYLDGSVEQGILESEPATLPGISTLTVIESGLPNGTVWGIALSGAGQFTTAAPDPLRVPLMNGTYAYTAVAPAGYYSVNGTGNVSMPRAEALDLVFEPVLYNATINESGLPHGTVWWFNSSEFPNAPIVAPNGVVLSLGDGGYPYAVGVAPDWSARPSDGILHVNGSSTALTVLFAPAPRYAVTFESTGLPGSVGWSVATDRSNASSLANGPIVVDLPNGTYSWSANASSPDYQVTQTSQASGAIVVEGAPVVKSVAFEPVTFFVTFLPRGLSNGSLWVLTVDGVPYPAANAAESTTVPLFGGPASYTASSENPEFGAVTGQVDVTPENLLVSIPFPQVEFLVTFSEEGLSAASSWGVRVGGSENFSPVSAGANGSFLLPNGTYPYAVEVPSGYTASPAAGTVWVNGTGSSVVILVQPTSEGSTSFSGWAWYLVIGALAVAALALLTLLVLRRRGRPRGPS